MSNNCKNCLKETNNDKFCGKFCSASFNNKGVRRHGRCDRKKCLNCDKLTNNNEAIYCSNTCQHLFNLKKLNDSIIKQELNGWVSIKRYLTETDNSCSNCNQKPFWNNKPLTLECDHIDGDCTNNRLKNARLLCPNCHSQTSTFRAKNMNNPKGKEGRVKRYKNNGAPGGI